MQPLSTVRSDTRSLRQAILDAATRLFAEHGYNATSVRAVVEAAGCTKPVLYYYFRHKADLFLQTLEESIHGMDGVISEALRIEGSVRKRLHCGLQAYLQWVQTNPVALRLLAAAERHPEKDQPAFDFDGIRNHHLAILRDLLEEGQRRGEVRSDLDAEEMALNLFGLIEHRVLLWLHGRPMPSDMADRIIDLFFEGIGV